MKHRIVIGEGTQEAPRKAVKIEMWYDRSRKEWVLYPVDENGYQIDAAQYEGRGKKYAQALREEMALEYLKEE